MNIIHDLLPKKKRRTQNSKVDISIYAYTEELLEELNHQGIIDRMKAVPQLGVIKVGKQFEKSRYDYVMLQLYFHQLIKNKLKNSLELTYNNPISASEFCDNFSYNAEYKKASVGDVIQILTIVYNIGHFYNTFVASRAVIMLAKDNQEFLNCVINAIPDARYQSVVHNLIHEENYYRFHLINSLLVLEKCDPHKQSVILAKEIIYAYLNCNQLPAGNKLQYVFRLFRAVRNVAYIAYDLQIAGVPLTIDLCNESQMTVFFKELLSEYNDRSSMQQLVKSITKMLDDTVYNESSDAICYFLVSKKIYNNVQRIQNLNEIRYYEDLFVSLNSAFNQIYSQNRMYCEQGVLKVTFQHKSVALSLVRELNHTNCVCAGYYDRNTGERTVVVSLKKNCPNDRVVASRVLKIVLKYIREIPDILPADIRYLLLTKFFLFYYFGRRYVQFKATVDKEVCVCCTRGKNNRVKELQTLLDQNFGNVDQRHEVEHMKYCMSLDNINDTTISIPSSILVFDVGSSQALCELDGMIIHPNRKEKQIMFLESKNKKVRGQAVGCLVEKLNKLGISYQRNQILHHDQDVYLELSI